MKSKNFEDMIKELEDISQELEIGKLSLDESLSKFEEGIKISKACSKIINDAEKKITLLIKDNEGNLKEEKFDIND